MWTFMAGFAVGGVVSVSCAFLWAMLVGAKRADRQMALWHAEQKRKEVTR